MVAQLEAFAVNSGSSGTSVIILGGNTSMNSDAILTSAMSSRVSRTTR
jgi:hypothetical protein